MPAPLARAARDALGLVRLLWLESSSDIPFDPELAARAAALEGAGRALARACGRDAGDRERERADDALQVALLLHEGSARILLELAANRLWGRRWRRSEDERETKRRAQEWRR